MENETKTRRTKNIEGITHVMYNSLLRGLRSNAIFNVFLYSDHQLMKSQMVREIFRIYNVSISEVI